MSKINFLIKEAKIVYSENKQPSKYYNNGDFKNFTFYIVSVVSTKKQQQNNQPTEWENKMLSIRCMIWNEKLADKFLNSFDIKQKNYITILDGQLTNFHIDNLTKTSNAGKEYQLSVYSFFNISVNNFVITHKAIDEEKNTQSSVNNSQEEIVVDDDIPF